MPGRSELFEYRLAEDQPNQDCAVVKVPAGIQSVDTLLHALAQALALPAYFGFNWNALSDCLRDLHWMPQRGVVLIHADLPHLPMAELTTYLNVLAEACQSWQFDEPHRLVVVFPVSARGTVASHLDEPL